MKADELEMFSREWFEYQRDIGPAANMVAKKWAALNHSNDQQSEALQFLRDILIRQPLDATAFDELWVETQADPYRPKVSEIQGIVLWEEYKLLMHESAYHRESVTEMALRLSLCPLHFVDYAICFADDNPQCWAIREVHPNHDT